MRTVIIEGVALPRVGLRAILTRGGHQVLLATPSASEALQAIDGGLTPEAVVLGDPSDVGCHEVAEKVLDLLPSVRVVVLLDGHTRAEVEELLRVGVVGVLSRVTDEQELLDGLVRVERGERVLSSDAIALLVPGRDLPHLRVGPAADQLLTDREQEVLTWLARGASNRIIAEALFIGVSTVKTHVSSIFTKLGVSSRHAAVSRAYETGLLDRRRPGGA